MTVQMYISLIIFILTFVILVTEKVHKTIVTIAASIALLFLGVFNQEEAFAFIDWNVLFLLAGMMIVVGIIKHTGLFQYIAIKTAKIAKGNPVWILLMLFTITAISSAFLDNVTSIIIVIPIVLLVAIELGISPIPFIITQAIASNIGGTATLIGDPPNIMIGSEAGLNFMLFSYHIAPVIVIITLVSLLITYLIFRKRFNVADQTKAHILQFNEKEAITDPRELVKALIVFGLFILGLLTQSLHHMEAATLAIASAVVLMLVSKKHDVEHLLMHEIEWGTIIFFMGLFMIVGSLEKTGIINQAAQFLFHITKGSLVSASFTTIWVSGIMSGIIDNIPFVATMIPIINQFGEHMGAAHHLSHMQIEQMIQPLWWSLSLGACLGGNFTLVGASANVVSVGLAKKAGYNISFWQFTKYGLLYTSVSLVISTLYIWLRYF